MDKIRWGVLGTANIGEGCTIPGMLQAENCSLYAIAGRSLQKAEAFKEKYGFQKAYGSYDELLLDESVQAVYIPLPNSLHYEWSIKALKQKKHVLCEKPIAPSEKEAAEMFQVAKENGVYLMEAFAYQHSPYIAAIAGEIADGAIGTPLYMDSTFLTSSHDVSNIRERRECYGGGVYDLGVYNTSLTLRLFGSEPARVQAVGTFTDQNIDQLASVILEYENGAKSVFTCGMLLAHDKHRHRTRFEIHGTKGVLQCPDFGFNSCGSLTYVIESFDGTVVKKTIETPHNYRLEVEQLGRCALGLETPAVTEEFSLANARIIDRILEKIGY